MKFLGLILLLFPFSGIAQSSNFTDLCFIENSEIMVLGTSNVTDYSCKLYDLSNNSDIKISSTIFGNTIKLKNAFVVLSASGFDCDNRIMTNDFFKAIKANKYPEVIVGFHQFTLSNMVADVPLQSNIPAKISINLAGRTNYYSILFESFNVSSDQLNITGKVDLLMTDFDITPPTALFGAVKTEDDIQISFNINFKFK